MPKISYVKPGTYLFRFMDPRGEHFWSAIAGMIYEKKLFLNSRTKFNDPYDSQPIVVDDMRNSTIRKYVRDMLQDPLNPARSPLSSARILEMRATKRTHLNKANLSNIRAALRSNALEVLDKAGILSFSLSADNSLLWAHYAASFAGLCAVFKRGISDDSALSVCANINYVDERPHLRQSLLHEMTTRLMANQPRDEIADEIFFVSFLHKSSDWAYEQEARIFHAFHAFKKLPFEPNELVGFIFGPNSSREFQEKMKQEIGKTASGLTLYNSSLSNNDFRIIVPHEFARPNLAAAYDTISKRRVS
jgi:hypothetical protein